MAQIYNTYGNQIWISGSERFMIFLGLGGNLDCETYGSPRRTCGAAIEILARRSIKIVSHSKWYESAPVPISDQPWFINGVVGIETQLSPEKLVKTVLDVEAELGRRRSVPNAARTIDIDVLAYHDVIISGSDHDAASDVEVPHPRMHSRAFVMLPLADIAPDWAHPNSGTHIRDLISALPKGQVCQQVPDGEGLSGTEWQPEGA